MGLQCLKCGAVSKGSVLGTCVCGNRDIDTFMRVEDIIDPKKNAAMQQWLAKRVKKTV